MIQEVAGELIFEKGCYHTTLQDILNRTGLSKGVMTQGYEKKRYSDVLKQISPVAWQHINLYGRYEFTKQQETVDMNAIIQELNQSKAIPK